MCVPSLWPENRLIYEVYRRVCGQHIMGSSRPIGLNLVPVFEVMDRLGIDKADQMQCVDMIQAAYNEVLKAMVEKK